MLWRSSRQSSNIEDRRGMDGGSGSLGGMRIPGRLGTPLGRGAGFGGLGLIAIVVIGLLFGIDPSQLLQGNLGGDPLNPSSNGPPAPTGAAEAELKDFVAVVLAETEDTWREQFRTLGRNYEEPTLVLFSSAVDSACGYAQSAAGPFYCPGDHKVYLDLSFFQQLAERFQAPGDFAAAYVVAHEVGHHVQNLLGIMDKVNVTRSRASEADANALSVRIELQADCFAGVWAKNADRTRHILEGGDIEEGLAAAAAVGDDRLQRQSQGYVVPDSFTHGSSEQRVRWFKRGLTSGQIDSCDTFNASQI
jgi:predicted metalloprotease